MKSKFKLFLLWVLLLPGGLVMVNAQDNIRMFLDYARFRYDDRDTYLEIYYMLYDVSEAETFSVENISLTFSLSDIIRDSTLATSQLDISLTNSNGFNLSKAKGSVIKTVLPPSKYKIKMVRKAVDGSGIDSLSREFTVKPFIAEKILLSDLELCANILTNSTNKKGLFYKNTMEVIPNPMRTYGSAVSQLYYYSEIYNLKSANTDEEVDVEIAIVDLKGNVQAHKQYKRKKAYESLVEQGMFDVSGLKNGLYTIVFIVKDPHNDYSVYTRNNFYVINSSEELAETRDFMALFAQSDYFSMAEPRIDEKFDQAIYIASQEERDIYAQLSELENKRFFLFKFWFDREVHNPGLEKEYYQRVEYANENFRFYNNMGWKSDRGRVHVIYGFPDQVLRHPLNPDARPFVVWFYHDLEGGARFLFVDESGFRDYKLMSSTMRGEIYDPSWDELLYSEQ